MSPDSKVQTPPGNKILAALSEKASKRLAPKLTSFDLKFGETIYEPGDVIKTVYFPDSGIVSLLATHDDESVIEIGMVGREGVVGLPTFLGVPRSRNRAVIQGQGIARAMKTTDFLAESEADPELSRLLRRYAMSLLGQVSQSAVCYRYHKIGARLARWLLMSSDRMNADEFQLTHLFLSHMLGVRREGVTKAARFLQDDEVIRYKRGKVKILDRPALEAVACQCYMILKNDSLPQTL